MGGHNNLLSYLNYITLVRLSKLSMDHREEHSLTDCLPIAIYLKNKGLIFPLTRISMLTLQLPEELSAGTV